MDKETAIGHILLALHHVGRTWDRSRCGRYVVFALGGSCYRDDLAALLKEYRIARAIG